MDGADTSIFEHPTAALRRYLQGLGYSKVELARMLGLSRQTLHDVLAGNQRITLGIALRVAKLTGTAPAKWLDLQQAHDLEVARRELRQLLRDIPTVEEAW